MHYIYLKFPGDALYTDVTSLVRHKSMSMRDMLINDRYGSARQLYRFAIKHNATIVGELFAAEGRIEAYVLDADLNRVITGVIEPSFTAVAQDWDRADDITLEIGDTTWPLDETIASSLQIPAIVTDSGKAIYDPADTGCIMYQILNVAGLAAAISLTAPAIPTVVRSFAMDADEGTYRQEIDELLTEHGYVIRAQADGKLTWFRWAQDAYTPSRTIYRDKSVVEPLTIARRFDTRDGAEVTWAQAEVIEDARLWDANLPVTTGAVTYPGVDIAAGDYWPPDGDIQEIWQDYVERWLDRPYNAGYALNNTYKLNDSAYVVGGVIGVAGAGRGRG